MKLKGLEIISVTYHLLEKPPPGRASTPEKKRAVLAAFERARLFDEQQWVEQFLANVKDLLEEG